MSTRREGEGTLPVRLARHLAAREWLQAGDPVVVACSGGLDSTVLLHLLRFGPDVAPLPRLALTVAHFDHRMRPESGDDAIRLGRLAEAWQLPVTVGRAERELRGETEARAARYRFLERVKAETGARWILLAHHADDQVETLLFRILRGTGLRGLAGMPEERAPGILRPLLPFRRRELEAYARQWDVPVVPDETNRDSRFARNVIRHEILPRAEEAVSARVDRALLRLARLARESEEGWASILPDLCAQVVVDRSRGKIVVDRDALLARHPAVQSRILRALLGGLGSTPNEAGTRAALEFTRTASSGQEWRLSGEVALTREFDRFVLSAGDAAEGVAGAGTPEGADRPDVPLLLTEAEPGTRSFRVGGRRLVAHWGPEAPPSALWVEPFPPFRLRFPLCLRGWLPGDRMRLDAGSRKLKKLFTEARIPVGERRKIPLLADASGEVIWIPGLAKAARMRVPEGAQSEGAEERPFFIGIEEAEDDGRP